MQSDMPTCVFNIEIIMNLRLLLYIAQEKKNETLLFRYVVKLKTKVRIMLDLKLEVLNWGLAYR